MAKRTETVVTTEEREYYVCDFCGQRSENELLELATEPSKIHTGEWEDIRRARNRPRFREERRHVIDAPVRYVEITNRESMDICRRCEHAIFSK